MPYYGPPRGFGLKQLDNWTDENGVNKECNATQRWNWKANVDGGIDVVKSKVKQVNNSFQDEETIVKKWIANNPNKLPIMEDITFGNITFTNSKSPIFPNLDVTTNELPTGKYSFLDAILIRSYNGGDYLFYLVPAKEIPNPDEPGNPDIIPPTWKVDYEYKDKYGNVLDNTSYIRQVCEF